MQNDRNPPPGRYGRTHRTRVDGLVDTLESYVERVLTALDHPEALVTDLSTIGNFGLDVDERSAASATLGVALSHSDYIHEVAQRLRAQAQGQAKDAQ